MSVPECPHGLKVYDDGLDGLWFCPSDLCHPEPVSDWHPAPPLTAATPTVPAPRVPPSEPRTTAIGRAVPVNRSDWEWAVLHCPNVAKTTLAVALAFSRFASFETGTRCHPGQPRVAGMVGVTTRAVRDCLPVLEMLGWLHVHRQHVYKGDGHPENRPTEYWLTVPSCHRHDEHDLPVPKW
jgi:hypothetical protein